jgi:hypothetical protein
LTSPFGFYVPIQRLGPRRFEGSGSGVAACPGGPNSIGDSHVVGGVTPLGMNGTRGGTGGGYRVDRADDLKGLYTTFGSDLSGKKK